MYFYEENKKERSCENRVTAHRVMKHLMWMLMLAGIVFITFPNSAKADVVFEPEDSFYASHYNDCYSVERYYIANGYEGKVIVYQNPTKKKVVEEYENGEKIYVFYAYVDKYDTKWGLIDGIGWFPLDYAYPLYDAVSFMNEHYDEYVYDIDVRSVDGIEEGDSFYFYRYPGAESGWEYVYRGDDTPYIDYTYTDPFGYEWGYVGYFYANRGWICLSHPGYTFEELYPEGQSFSGVIEIPEECGYEIIPGKKPQVSDADDDDKADNKKDNDKKDKDEKDRDRDRPSSPGIPLIVIIIASVILGSVCSTVVIIIVIKKNSAKKNQ